MLKVSADEGFGDIWVHAGDHKIPRSSVINLGPNIWREVKLAFTPQRFHLKMQSAVRSQLTTIE